MHMPWALCRTNRIAPDQTCPRTGPESSRLEFDTFFDFQAAAQSATPSRAIWTDPSFLLSVTSFLPLCGCRAGISKVTQLSDLGSGRRRPVSFLRSCDTLSGLVFPSGRSGSVGELERLHAVR